MINQIELLYKARFYSIHFRSDESSKIMALNFIAKAPANFLRFSQPRLKTFVKYAKVELTPPSPGELGQVMTSSSSPPLPLLDCDVQVVKGTAGLVGDALPFKWAQASMAQVAVNTVVVAEV